ncbi:hypothetical protein NKOR_08130 [Candidatus Nitrosopumilus koreensis AR1]|uniref:Uncharacterized protein n=1 Tax=Candidatus Nitrosopumilus koreensis AR1 TaxID=1229908 RepID=K0B8P2_9ARCH|nr:MULTISPECIES: hypothetical protein [Nitrosopumilus]AFS81487.1 hypothetical protein NKOR_08130 [Candidatus Nitrosopumilus koreensis AR1]
MKKSLLAGTIIAIAALTMAIVPVMANGSNTDIVSATTDGNTVTIEVADDVKNINKKSMPDAVVFYATSIPTQSESEAVRVNAVVIHPAFNDHQVGVERSSPVQGYHPHEAAFDGSFCLTDITSPALEFSAKDHFVIVENDEWTGFAATGTIGPRDECASGLGITSIFDTN